ncbi:MAG: NYN domain-containing protein [Omnitrophica bacterium]|nr:NYN domain-containing protein [Candidatus Omnitrophota bacterium]
MKKIIVDGYNAIHKIPEMSNELDKSLSAARTALAMHMASWRGKGMYSRALIAFDGQDSVMKGSSQVKLCGIDCVFARTREKADNLIIRMVRDAKDASKITVVSDDNYVRNNSRAHGAEVKSVAFLRSPTGKQNNPSGAANKNIATERAQAITDEYEEYLRAKGKI